MKLTTPLPILHRVLDTILIGAAVALAILFQPELRKLLEQLGRGDWFDFLPALVRPATGNSSRKGESVLEELVQAVRELSQNRTGALIAIEIDQPIDPRIFTDMGVPLDARLSKELLQTIFQTSTLLHDGAVLVRGDTVKAAGVILPVSDRAASRQLGTRHRAAMGITEQAHCLCIVVSEETGSISLAEAGRLERPLTSMQLRDLLAQRLRPQLETVTSPALWSSWSTERPLRSPRQFLSVLRKTLSKK